jgi:hypothetical protein
MGKVNGKGMLLMWGLGGAISLFLLGGGMNGMGGGSSSSTASFSPSCEAPSGKWVICSGRVLSISREGRGFKVEIRTHVGERVFLTLDGWDGGLLPINSEVEFKVKGVGDSRYFSEVSGITVQTLEKYCTGVRWKRSQFEPLELGRRVEVNLRKHPELGREGIKYVYIRGSSISPSGYEVVSVEQGEERGCMPGVNMLSE